jgi:protein TonB
LLQIDLLKSSGSAALDRAAVDTVEKLAPFAPFPQALARETQQLDIIRTWQFRR